MNYFFTGTMRERLVFWLITSAMVISVAMYSGKTVYALLILEIIGGCLLLLTLWNPGTVQLSKLTLFILAFIVLSPLLYLIPIPQSIWETLPSRPAYTEALNWLINNNQSPWLSLSLVPLKTLHAFISLTSLAAIFLATASLSEKKQIQLTYIFISIASIQAIIGLIQYGNPTTEWISPAISNHHLSGNATGSYLNRDHFVALMYLCLPIAIGLMLHNMGRENEESKNSIFSSLLKNHFLMFFSVTMLVLLGGIFSRSRAGIFLIILAIILSLVLFARHAGGRRSAGLTVTIGVLGLGSAVSIGLIPVLNRFLALNPAEDGRWTFFSEAIAGIKFFFPYGSGPGTFQDIFRTLQPVDLLPFLNHVHNDYLELFFEMGLIGMLILILLLTLYIQGWINMKNYSWGKYRFIKVATGISLFLIVIHSLVDFNTHTPANAVFICFLTALFLSKK